MFRWQDFNQTLLITTAALLPQDDTWPFGLQSGYNTTYLGGLLPPWQVLWERYSSRNVHHSIGLADTWVGTMGCEVTAQGAGHMNRAFSFFHRVQTKLGGMSPNHTIDYIPGIGHDSYAMFNYPWTVYRMFFESKQDNKTLPSQVLINGDISYQFPNEKWNATKLDKQTWIDTQQVTRAKWQQLTGQSIQGGEDVDGDDDTLDDGCTEGDDDCNSTSTAKSEAPRQSQVGSSFGLTMLLLIVGCASALGCGLL